MVFIDVLEKSFDFLDLLIDFLDLLINSIYFLDLLIKHYRLFWVILALIITSWLLVLLIQRMSTNNRDNEG
jgi:hypothetical protein